MHHTSGRSALLAGSLIALCLAGVSRAEGLCLAGEEPVFACTTAKAMAYVCASKPFVASTATMQYRFGRPGRIAFAYPVAPAPAAGHFVFSNTAYGGGGEAHLRFSNGGYDYLLYDRVVAEDPDAAGRRKHDVSTGVLVSKSGRVVSNSACIKPQDSMRGAAYQGLPGEPFDDNALPDPSSARN